MTVAPYPVWGRSHNESNRVPASTIQDEEGHHQRSEGKHLYQNVAYMHRLDGTHVNSSPARCRQQGRADKVSTVTSSSTVAAS